MPLPTTYTSSKGEEHVITDMPYPYLKNATLKTERMEPGTELAQALRIELDKREAAHAAEQAEQHQR